MRRTFVLCRTGLQNDLFIKVDFCPNITINSITAVFSANSCNYCVTGKIYHRIACIRIHITVTITESAAVTDIKASSFTMQQSFLCTKIQRIIIIIFFYRY